MAKQNSPGLQACVGSRPERASERVVRYEMSAMDLRSVALSGRVSEGPYPGLKTWAILYSRFAAKSGSRLGCSL